MIKLTNYGVYDSKGKVTQVAPDADAPQVDTAVETPADAVGNAVAEETAPAGPSVVDAAEVEASAPERSEPFDGTLSVEQRAEADAEIERVAAENADKSEAVAKAQREEDLRFATEHPNSPVARPANEAVGGESFSYGE